MTTQFNMAARISVAFSLVCRDKDGNALKTIKVQGGVPMTALGLTKDEVREIIKELPDDDNRQ